MPAPDTPPDREAPCPRCGRAASTAWQVCAWCGAPLLTTAELPAGAELGDGRYEVLGVIGRGGFGITYQVRDRRLQRTVAVKELFPDKATRHGRSVDGPPEARSAFDEARTRFLNEARVLARFSHPGIVRVYEVFEENNTAYLVMELLEGPTLAALLRDRGRPFDEGDVLSAAHALAAGLRTVHSAGVLHRDLNPTNVIVTGGSRLVLIDFGIARVIEPGTQSLTQIVTPGYAPPEQYAGAGRFGPATDVYGLAATLYRLLTNQKPLPAIDRQGGEQMAPPHRLAPSVSKATSDAVMDGLELNPDHRPRTIDAFAARLRLATAPTPSSGAAPFRTAPRPPASGPGSPGAAPAFGPVPVPSTPRPGEGVAPQPDRAGSPSAAPAPIAPRSAAPAPNPGGPPSAAPADRRPDPVAPASASPPPSSAAGVNAWANVGPPGPAPPGPDDGTEMATGVRPLARPATPPTPRPAEPAAVRPPTPVPPAATPYPPPSAMPSPSAAAPPMAYPPSAYFLPPSHAASPVAVVGPNRAGRWKVTIPLAVAALALTSAAPVILAAVLVAVVLPALATAGDLQLRRARQEQGATVGRFAQTTATVAAPARFVANLATSLARALPALALDGVLVGAWLLVRETDLSASVTDLILRAAGVGVAGVLLYPLGRGSRRFRTDVGIDAIAEEIVDEHGRLYLQGYVLWLVCIGLAAFGLWLSPDPWPFTAP